MTLRRRLLATLAVLALAGAGAAFALAADEPAEPPSIALDAGGPLFSLQGLEPGDPPVERCIGLRARGGTATRLELSGAVSGPLADDLRMEVDGGSGPDPGTARACAGFAAEQRLWAGTLADFPGEGAAAVSNGALADGARRLFRFRVWLPADAVVAQSETAEQQIRWRAELEVPTTPTTTPTVPTTPPPGPPQPPARPPATTTPRTGGQSLPQRTDGRSAQQPCRPVTARRCRGRLVARLTPRAIGLHVRVHAPGDVLMRRIELRLPTTFGGSGSGSRGGARIVLSARRTRGSVVELDGRLAPRRGGDRSVTLARLPGTARTVLLRLRLPRAARPALRAAACRRAPVLAILTLEGTRRGLRAPLYISSASCATTTTPQRARPAPRRTRR